MELNADYVCRRAVLDDAERRAALSDGTHFLDEMKHEGERAVGDAGESGAEAAVVALLFVLFAHSFLRLLPLDAKGRIREHVVERFAPVAVVGEGVAGFDAVTSWPLMSMSALQMA